MDPATYEQNGSITDQGAYTLAPNLVFDPHACVLVRRGRRISLIARECALLARLLRTPCQYVSTRALSQHMSTARRCDFPIEEHSI